MADVRYRADFVRFTPRSRHSGQDWECLKLTQSGHLSAYRARAFLRIPDLPVVHGPPNRLEKPPVDHVLRRSGFSFVGKLLRLRNPILYIGRVVKKLGRALGASLVWSESTPTRQVVPGSSDLL